MTRAEKTIYHRQADPLLFDIAGFMMDKAEWTGTATELLELLSYPDLKPHVLTRKMNDGVSILYNRFGISYVQNKRTRDERTFTLRSLNPVMEPEPLTEEPAETDSTDP